MRVKAAPKLWNISTSLNEGLQVKRMSQLIEASETSLIHTCTKTPQYEAGAENMERASKAPSLIASTSDIYCCSIADSRLRESKPQDVSSQEQSSNHRSSMKDEELESNYFKSAQWFAPNFLTKSSR